MSYSIRNLDPKNLFGVLLEKEARAGETQVGPHKLAGLSNGPEYPLVDEYVKERGVDFIPSADFLNTCQDVAA